jgi:hypothetical protein
VQSATFARGRLRLVGYLLRPTGDGPRPALIWNHGWGPPTGRYHPFSETLLRPVCAFVEERQWTYFFVFRRGYGDAEGEPIQEYDARVHWTMSGEVLADAPLQRAWQEADGVVAATAYLKSQPSADRRRVAVSGLSWRAGHHPCCCESPGSVRGRHGSGRRSRRLASGQRCRHARHRLRRGSDACPDLDLARRGRQAGVRYRVVPSRSRFKGHGH